VAGTCYKLFNASYSPGVRGNAAFPISVRILKDLNSLGEWAVENEMKINPDKSKAVSFKKLG